VYQISGTDGVQVLLPPKYIAELKALPEDTLSGTKAIEEALQSDYTGFSPGHNSELLILLLRTKLTQNLARLVPQLREELEYLVDAEFPVCEDWTCVKWQPFSLRAVARVSGRAFVGTAISRQEAWVETSINFAIHVFMAGIKLSCFPAWLRPVGQYLVMDLGKIKKDIRVAKGMLQPVLEERLRRREECNGQADPDAPDDLIQWFVDSLSEDERADAQVQAELQLMVAAASIHTTNGLLCECMYDLAALPEIQQELFEEAHDVLIEQGGWQRKEMMAKLKKMDSFMREAQRLSGNITSFLRKVMKPISLSDGTRLPAGTSIIAPQAGISHDERFFQDADTFDALRFYRLRERDDQRAREEAEGYVGGGNRWLFTSISDTNVNFGAGRHACPGRFFAGNEIKLILAYFLLRYEVRLKEGEERPKPMAYVMTKSPNMTAELEFKRRRTSTRN
jgi:cytochrome P450